MRSQLRCYESSRPAAIQAALQAQRQEAQQRDQVRDALTRDLEAARFAADRAFRQYDASDPQNRLVTAELELRWNRALEQVAEVQARIAAHENQRPAPLSAPPDDFRSLAGDLQAAWADPASDARLKKRIVRTLLQEIIADIDAPVGEIILTLHWAGGIHTELRLPRRRRGQRNSTAVEVVEAVRVLVRIANDNLIAGLLNRNKLTTGHGNRWTRERVTALRSHHQIPVYCAQLRDHEGWLTLSQAAALLTISAKPYAWRPNAAKSKRYIRSPTVLGSSTAPPSRANRFAASNLITAPAIPPRDRTPVSKTSIYQ